MSAWVVVLVAGAGSFLFRFSIVALIDHVATPVWLDRLAGYVVPAAFAGLAASALAEPLGDGGTEGLSLGAAGLVTAVTARRAKSSSSAFVAGLVTLWVVTALTAHA